MAPRLLLVPSLTLLAGILAAEDVITPAPAPADTLTVESQTVENATTGTKNDTSPLTQPQSIGVVDHTFIREQHAIRLEDALRNVAGVHVGGYYNDWDYYRIRGFDAANSTRLDGLWATPGIWINEEVYGLERIEVLKGPAAMLYGQTPIGGMVNLVSKKPKADDFATVMASAGSYDFAELGADAGVGLADDALGVRLVALGRNRGSWVDGVDDSQRFYVAPSATWWAGEHTTITLLSHYVYDDVNAAWPLPASGFITSNPNGDLPLDRNIGEPGYQNRVERSRLAGGYELEHRFNDQVALRQHTRVARFESDFAGIYASSLDADGRTLNRTVYTYVNERLDAQADTMLDLRLATGTVRHDVLVGVDLAYSHETATGGWASIAPLDLYDPAYGATPGPVSPYSQPEVTTRTIGLYVQDQATIGEHLTVTAGMRFDTIDTENIERLTDTTTGAEDTGFTWRLGATWTFAPGTAAFASYATAFAPQPYDRDADGDIVDPETGNQMEVGVRTLDPAGRYQATAAVFQITREDVATADLGNPGASVITGEQRSRGLELDGRVNPYTGWSLTGTYAWIEAEVTEDNDLPAGTRLRNVPKHSVTAWIRYTLPDTALRGLGIGLGGRWYGDQAGDAADSFALPAYTVIDAGLFYDRGPLSAQLNAYNLFDEEYAVGSWDDLYVLPGDPLTVRGSISYTF
jgi:iron complex outermembrane recepter protein